MRQNEIWYKTTTQVHSDLYKNIN